tara:strand:+ start:275 stop:517 length:243 start_codon:yes stop_codon:yes gene_type:complete
MKNYKKRRQMRFYLSNECISKLSIYAKQINSTLSDIVEKEIMKLDMPNDPFSKPDKKLRLVSKLNKEDKPKSQYKIIRIK